MPLSECLIFSRLKDINRSLIQCLARVTAPRWDPDSGEFIGKNPNRAIHGEGWIFV